MPAEPANDPFAALGDPHRRAIVEILAVEESSVVQIADQLPISRPAVSRHLRLLKEAGLVADRPEGNRRIYRLDDDGFQSMQAYMREVWGDAVTRFRIAAENTTER